MPISVRRRVSETRRSVTMPNIEQSRLRRARFGPAHRLSIVFVIFAVLFLAMAGSISAAFADSLDMQNCLRDDEQSFAACTRIIEDKTVAPDDLGRAYTARGNAWLDVKHDYDRAIADFTAAIGINPADGIPYYGRGNAWIAKGDQNRAIAD